MAMDASINDESLISSFDAWFLDNGIQEFKPNFLQLGFNDLGRVAEITTKEELEKMGIILLGAQLKLMSKIRALKRPSAERSTAAGTSKRLKQSSKYSIFQCYQIYFLIKV